MAHFKIQNVTFTYPEERLPALSDVSLSVAPGEFVVLCGPSGSGKSTLLRLLKREVSPGGRMSGSILLNDSPLHEWTSREAAAMVGLVMQNPDNQLVVDTVEHELAFGMENFGLDRDVMRRRMAEMAGFFGLEPLLGRRTDELSGGQKQTVNLAAVLMLQPRVLLLDEPLAQLDPLAARELLAMIKRLNDEWGISVIMCEHRLDDLLPLADRVVRLDCGRIVFDGKPRDFAAEAWNRNDADWISALPSITRWAIEQGPQAFVEPPISVKEARLWLHKRGNPTQYAREHSNSTVEPTRHGEPLLSADQIFFAYDKHSPAVLRGVDWQIRRGDWGVLFGGNGSGKSTLLQLLAGIRMPQRGSVKWGKAPLSRKHSKEQIGAIGYLAQSPVLHYAHDTLLEDLKHAANRAGIQDAEQEARAMADRFGIAHLLTRHPHDMSGGEQQIGALAMILLAKPQMLLLDEPTKGLDPQAKKRLATYLKNIHTQGTTILMATHDVEFAAAYANRCSLLFHGEIVADGEPEPFFRGEFVLHHTYAPAAERTC
ncbi:ABC transporter ATP-binding protein [Cohnella kolymensis]|uniref:ABC transporter ATP-binding protein n=1 Tax=Cohnella kolymensis TaxID=1590652 RepID=UPI000698F3D2|nr:ATP-binding cassette domain-containing protein [Cohnella kolymensis]